MKLRQINNDDGSLYGYSFKCPGCGHYHDINTEKPRSNGAQWKFNGDINNPTFQPSVNTAYGHFVDGQPQPPDCFLCNEGMQSCGRCHFFIIDGKIHFCSDCTHHLNGVQNVELPDIND